MKTKHPLAGRLRLLALAGTLLSAPWIAGAQNLAPDSLAGSLLAVKVVNGHTPFATNGSYLFFTSVAGTNYIVLGCAGPLSSGACQYLPAGSNATATLVDALSGPGISLSLAFASPTNGTLALTNSTGFQTGTFTLASYVEVSPPQLFLPRVTGGQFQSYLSGQAGFIYSIDTSSNLVTWQPWLNLPIADLTTNFGDPTSRPARFYRARLSSTAFAPANLTNQTFNLTVTDGKSPLATNGICQWMADTNDNNYQVIGGPGTVSSSGSYTYTRTDPNSGLISCQDSGAGTLREQLMFTSPESGYFYATNSAGFEVGTFTMAAGVVEFLGNFKFTPDTARAGSLYFAADGSPASLSVTNAAGWIWTLNFPADALLVPRTITMTPLTNLDTSDSLLPLASGVQMSPDGIQFSDCVTLTAKPPAPLGAHAALLMAANDGSALCIVPSTNQANTYSTTLFHFSSAVATDPSQQQWNVFLNNYLPLMQAAYQNYVKQAESLEGSVVVPPEPPDYDWNCDADIAADESSDIDYYQELLFGRENQAIRQLLGAAKTLELMSVQVTPDEISTARELVETAMYRKVDLLFSQYSGNPKKFMAVSRIALNILYLDELLAGSGRPDWLSEIQNWGINVENYYWDQLRNHHMYSKALVLPQMVNSLKLLGVNINMSDFQSQLTKALTFKLTLDLSVSDTEWDSEGNVDGQDNAEARGDATLQAGLTTPYPVVTNNTIMFVSGYQVDFFDKCTEVLDPGQSSTWVIGLGLEACGQAPQVILALVEIGDETWTGCDHISKPDPILGSVFAWAFDLQPPGVNGYGGKYCFPLTDGRVVVVNQTLERDSSTSIDPDPLQDASGTLQIQLQHTPQ